MTSPLPEPCLVACPGELCPWAIGQTTWERGGAVFDAADMRHGQAGQDALAKALKSLGFEVLMVEVADGLLSWVQSCSRAGLKLIVKFQSAMYYEKLPSEMAQPLGAKIAAIWRAVAAVKAVNAHWPGMIRGLWMVDDAFLDGQAGIYVVGMRAAIRAQLPEIPIFATVVFASGWLRRYAESLANRLPAPDVIVAECYPWREGNTPEQADEEVQLFVNECLYARGLLKNRVGILLQGMWSAPTPGAYRRWVRLALDAKVDIIGNFHPIDWGNVGQVFDRERVAAGRPFSECITDFGREVRSANLMVKASRASL